MNFFFLKKKKSFFFLPLFLFKYLPYPVAFLPKLKAQKAGKGVHSENMVTFWKHMIEWLKQTHPGPLERHWSVRDEANSFLC